MSTTREKISMASRTTLSIPNKGRPPETPGPGTSIRITPTASSTRPKVFPLRTAKFWRKTSRKTPRWRPLEGHKHKRPHPGFDRPPRTDKESSERDPHAN
ncbi:hypothetical protein F2Q69_00015262 [Brassica cretica]|uniref:Uncharacterized protein n=1 Tax=Brassica cretica TaxID=69181 RepID=A0A8S9QKJ3_BRACR|nr:hypothetical protein F2Q69_00015262 [Brassica cretica]